MIIVYVSALPSASLAGILKVTLSYWSTLNVVGVITGASLTGVNMTVIAPAALASPSPVSYTHLTLPTNLRV